MRRALVTGASRGIGRALVAELAGRGLEVVATARSVADIADLPAAVRLPLDVTSDASVAAAVRAAGSVDLLVNNAAVGACGPVENIPAETARTIFDTNVVGPLRLVSALLPGMRARGSGAVVNVSSVTGRAVFPLTGVHAASKHALEALSEALAMEAGPLGIRVLVIQLGSVATGMDQQRYCSAAYPHLDRPRHGRTPPLTPERAARAIVDAAVATDSPLRVPVGDEATSMLAERARLDDTAWAVRVREFPQPTG